MAYPHPRRYACRHSRRPLAFTGDLTQGGWQDAPWTEDFIDIQGEHAPIPWYRTRVKMLWDEQFLYVGAEMEEPHLWATYDKHDMIVFHENDFEVFIDPDGDHHRYYEIEINALGTVFDLRLDKPYRDGGPAVHEWHATGMLKRVTLRGSLNDPTDVDEGWTVELAIPWTCLDVSPPVLGDVWRINFSRVQWALEVVEGRYRKVEDRAEDNWVWSPQWAIDMHRPEHWGYVLFGDAEADDCPLDPDHDSKELLMDLYWKQRAAFTRDGRYVLTLAELGIAGSPIKMNPTSEGYVATLGDLVLSQDSRLVRRRDG